jgi:hypothetical protein
VSSILVPKGGFVVTTSIVPGETREENDVGNLSNGSSESWL